MDDDTDDDVLTADEADEAARALYRKGREDGRREERERVRAYGRFFAALNGDGDKFLKALDTLDEPANRLPVVAKAAEPDEPESEDADTPEEELDAAATYAQECLAIGADSQPGLDSLHDRAHGGTVLKAWSEASHPRADDGRFVSAGEIRSATRDPKKADALRASVTDPDERAKLDARLVDSKPFAGPERSANTSTALAHQSHGRLSPELHSVEGQEHVDISAGHLKFLIKRGDAKGVRECFERFDRNATVHWGEAKAKALKQLKADYGDADLSAVRAAFDAALEKTKEGYESLVSEAYDYARLVEKGDARQLEIHQSDYRALFQQALFQLKDTYDAQQNKVWDAIEATRDALGGKAKGYKLGRYFKAAWREELHPREDNGHFASKAAIKAAIKDPAKADALRAKVTNPDERKKLDDVLSGDVHHSLLGNAGEVRQKVTANRDEGRAIRDRLRTQHQMGEPLDPDDLRALIPHLSTMTHAELANVRVMLSGAGAGFKGKRLRADRVKSLVDWARDAALHADVEKVAGNTRLARYGREANPASVRPTDAEDVGAKVPAPADGAGKKTGVADEWNAREEARKLGLANWARGDIREVRAGVAAARAGQAPPPVTAPATQDELRRSVSRPDGSLDPEGVAAAAERGRHPFPVVKRTFDENAAKAASHTAPLEELRPEDLHATQGDIDAENYARLASGAAPATEAHGNDPVVVREPSGRLVLADGHHRAVLAATRGAPLRARVVDVDAAGKPVGAPTKSAPVPPSPAARAKAAAESHAQLTAESKPLYDRFNALPATAKKERAKLGKQLDALDGPLAAARAESAAAHEALAEHNGHDYGVHVVDAPGAAPRVVSRHARFEDAEIENEKAARLAMADGPSVKSGADIADEHGAPAGTWHTRGNGKEVYVAKVPRQQSVANPSSPLDSVAVSSNNAPVPPASGGSTGEGKTVNHLNRVAVGPETTMDYDLNRDTVPVVGSVVLLNDEPHVVTGVSGAASLDASGGRGAGTYRTATLRPVSWQPGDPESQRQKQAKAHGDLITWLRDSPAVAIHGGPPLAEVTNHYEGTKGTIPPRHLAHLGEVFMHGDEYDGKTFYRRTPTGQYEELGTHPKFAPQAYHRVVPS